MFLPWATVIARCRERLPYYCTQHPRRLILLSSCHYWNSSWTWILLFIKCIMTTLQFLPVYKVTSACKTSAYVQVRLKWLTLNMNWVICQKNLKMKYVLEANCKMITVTFRLWSIRNYRTTFQENLWDVTWKWIPILNFEKSG